MTVGFDALTDKQREIVSLIIEGYTQIEVADKLGFSKQHVYQVYRDYRTGISSKTGKPKRQRDTEYKDRGCKHSPTCQECPFPDCIM